jgi:hypothetical protein
VLEQPEAVVGLAADGLERGVRGGADLHGLAVTGQDDAG